MGVREPIETKLTRTEVRELRDALRKIDERRKYGRATWNGLVKKWAELIHRIEIGYDDCLDEYTNDLCIRDLIARLLADLPLSIEEKFTPHVQVLDERYRAATVPEKRPLFWSEPDWWWSRSPAKLVGDLRADIEHLRRYWETGEPAPHPH